MHLGLLPETGHVQRQQSQGVQLRQANPQTLQHIMGTMQASVIQLVTIPGMYQNTSIMDGRYVKYLTCWKQKR